MMYLIFSFLFCFSVYLYIRLFVCFFPFHHSLCIFSFNLTNNSLSHVHTSSVIIKYFIIYHSLYIHLYLFYFILFLLQAVNNPQPQTILVSNWLAWAIYFIRIILSTLTPSFVPLEGSWGWKTIIYSYTYIDSIFVLFLYLSTK